MRLAVAEASVRYISPARYDDRILVATRLTGVTSRTMIFDYTILNADSSERLATARTTLISARRHQSRGHAAGRRAPRALERPES